MVILGIDPGLATVGFGMLDYVKGSFKVIDYGAVLTPAGMALEERLLEIYRGITELCETYKPQALSIEELFFNDNRKTAVTVCEARGVILLAAHKCGVPIFEYTPLQVKQAVTGYGRAEKHQVQYMVTNILKLREVPKPDDTADALAMAICHGYSQSSLLFGMNN